MLSSTRISPIPHILQAATVMTVTSHITAATYQVRLEILTAFQIFPILYTEFGDVPSPKVPLPERIWASI